MAKFHNEKLLEHHEDTTNKHSLTDNEIDFLINFQTELNTQNTMSTASPRYWVIRSKVRKYNVEYGDKCVVDDDGIVAETSAELIEHLSDVYYDDAAVMKLINVFVREGFNKPDCTIEMGHILTMIEDSCPYISCYRVVTYDYEEITQPNAIFLTEKDASNHLKINGHNYPHDSWTYCMHGYRSFEFEQLIKILETVDWSKLK